MAQKLRDINVDDFTGGLRGDKSDYQMNKNESKDLRNFNIDHRGKLRKRAGYHQFGTSLLTTLDFAFTYTDPVSLGGGLFLVFDRASNAKCFKLVSTSLENSIALGDTTVTTGSNTAFAASGTFEVEGDIITYTSKPSGTTFAVTGSTILKAHSAGAGVRQFLSSVNTGVDSRAGIYGTTLAGLLYLTGIATAYTTADGVSFTSRTASNGLFAVTYRERIFVAGTGSGGGNNSSVLRVSYSNAGDATTWDTNNFFDVNDVRDEPITGLFPFNDRLLIFKQNSIFAYNEVQLKQTETDVGAYNHRVIQEIDGIIYTFCPGGIYATNGSSSKKISGPVEHILKAFYPTYDTAISRVINNCFATKYDKKYILYLGDTLLFPSSDNRDSSKTLRNVALVYDTEEKNWTVNTFNSTFTFFMQAAEFPSGGNTTQGNKRQGLEALFGLGSDVFRMFDSRELGFDSGSNVRGGPIFADNIANSVGVEISAINETPFFDSGNPSWWKRFGYVRSLIETGDFSISYRLDKGDYITDWISLGTFRKPNERIKLPDSEGYRIALKITTNQGVNISEFNGLIIEEIEAISQESRRHG